MSDNRPPERDWAKEPYNTWDTLAAMRIPPMPLDKGDLVDLVARLTRIENLLQRLVAQMEPEPHE